MSKITCQLICHRNSTEHVEQIYTGFVMLYKAGLINLVQTIMDQPPSSKNQPNYLRDAKLSHLRVIVNNSLNLYYDLHDSWEIDEEDLNSTDSYFKRSFFRLGLKSTLKSSRKVCPLGLNYEVYPSSVDKFSLKRNIRSSNIKTRLLDIGRSLNLLDAFVFTPRVNVMEALPNIEIPPKILFIVMAYDPYEGPELRDDKVLHRIRINEMRAEIIKALRSEFGEDFYGGFIHNSYAVKSYRNLLLPDKGLASKRRYVKLLESFPICVATTGLHGSIGWKLAEYIAFSKVILSEELNYEVPGDLIAGKNYLAFSTPEDCVKRAKEAFLDRELRHSIMLNNCRYYRSYLRPDSLVLNTLLAALAGQCK